jgi:hypothetical protein
MELTDKELEIIARRRAEKPYTKRMAIALGLTFIAVWATIPFEGLGIWRVIAAGIMALAYVVYSGWQVRLWEKATRKLKSDMDNELSIECGVCNHERQTAAAR